MKKRYLNPQMNVFEVKMEGIVCTSGDRQDYEEITWAIILGGGE